MGIAFAINSLGFILVWKKISEFTPVQFLRSLKKPLFSGILMFIMVKASQQLFVGSVKVTLLTSILTGVVSYGLTILFLTKGNFLKEIKELLLFKNL